MKHIVLLSAFFTPFRSGAEAMAEEVPQLLGQHRFTIITARLSRALPKQETLGSNTTIRRIGVGFWIDKWLYPFLAPRVVRAIQPNLVHANLESFAGLALIKCTQFPTILTCQSTNTTYKGMVSSMRFVQKMHKVATKITVLSSALQQRAEQLGRTDAVRIPNAVHIHNLPKRKPIFGRIVFAGRLEPMKGIDTLLKAFVELPSHAHLRIIGSGSLLQQLKRKASMLKIADRVTFVGQLTHEQVLLEFAEAEIFCGLSRTEAFGNVFVEALATQCAVVATNVDGIPDIIQHDVNGLLVEPDNPKQAAAALRQLLQDEQLRKRLVEAGQKTVVQFDWHTIAQQYNNVYMELLS